MAYTFDQIFAADPANQENVASGATITIFAPGDALMTPLAIMAPDGSPLANPVRVNANGFGSAFIADIDRVAWSGGGFSAFFTSYEGMKAEAVSARQAAQDAADQAATAATAPTDAAVDESVDKKLPAAITDVLANDPTVLSSAATMAQSTAGLVPAWKANTAYTGGQKVIAPNGDVVAAKVNFTSSTTYSATNWTPSTQDGRIGTVEATGASQDLRIAAVETKKVDDADGRLARKVQYGEYAIPFTDPSGYVSGGVQSDGVWNHEKPPRVRGAADVTLRPINTTDWAIPFTDPDGYVAGGIRPDGSAEFVKLKLSPANILQIANETVGYTRSLRNRIASIGDSLTAGYFAVSSNPTADAYPARLQALLPAGVQVFNIGTSGFTVDEEAVRIGALPVPLAVTGGAIPASGPVTVTTTAVIGWRAAGTARNIPGSVAGVPGILSRNSSNTVFTFTRSAAGATVPAPGTPVFVPDYAGHEADTAIVMLGRNNVTFSIKGAEATIGEHVAKGITRIVNWLSPSIKHVLIVSTTTTSDETAGMGGYNNVLDINTRLAAAYPSRFLDLRSYLVHQAIYDLGITPTTADQAAMSGDTLPLSIMDEGTDVTHWSKATAALVAAQINNYLTTRGWV